MKSDEPTLNASTRRNPRNCGRCCEHTNKNIIRKNLINIGIQMFSRKRLANFLFFFSFSVINYATLFLRRERLGAEKISCKRTFDLTSIIYRSPFTDHFPDAFRLLFVYAFLRASSFFHPVSFYTITHAFTRTLSCHDLEKNIL